MCEGGVTCRLGMELGLRAEYDSGFPLSIQQCYKATTFLLPQTHTHKHTNTQIHKGPCCSHEFYRHILAGQSVTFSELTAIKEELSRHTHTHSPGREELPASQQEH